MDKLTPPRGYSHSQMQNRLSWLEKRTGVRLPEFALDPPESFKGLVENQIGYVGLPMSIAGPLLVNGKHAKGEFYVPLCTVEGTLALSITRGCMLTSLAGGIEVRHIRQELSRAPIFTFEHIGRCAEFIDWVSANIDAIREQAHSTTQHGHLIKIEKYPMQNCVILDFIYNTADAAGQNMVTFATKAACDFICQNLPADLKAPYLLESNFCSDKNPSFRSLIHGRGHYVIASTTIEERLLRRILHVSLEEVLEAFHKMHIGSQIAGVLGFNLNVSNALAALYLATGQDVACVAENAIAIASWKEQDGKLYLTLSMPSITVGTIGGATRLRQQQSNLQLLGCSGPGTAAKLAEIICATCLTLECSLGAAIISGEFAQAHNNFGR